MISSLKKFQLRRHTAWPDPALLSLTAQVLAAVACRPNSFEQRLGTLEGWLLPRSYGSYYLHRFKKRFSKEFSQNRETDSGEMHCFEVDDVSTLVKRGVYLGTGEKTKNARYIYV